jgi:BirA family transcriptional regulator, biotin operon repressor / biotin---[acetyl-CoA-carboxylase] ligase
VGLDEDLVAEALAADLPGRLVRSYPALLSTEADALAWARSGAPEGAVVVAGYQVSARGRAGLPWEVRQGSGLAFSLILRPELPAEREGWVYTVATLGLADTLGEGATIAWPDEVRRAGTRAGAVGAWVELGAEGVRWAVVNLLVPGVAPPRGPMLARVVEAVEARLRAGTDAVLDDYRARCETLGRPVRARLIPLGPSGPRVQGRAVDVLADGAMLIQTARGTRVAVRPQNLGLLDELDPASPPTPEVGGGPAPR